LLQHLNQPSSQCYNWNDNLVRILRPPPLRVRVPSPPYEDTFEDTTAYTPVNSGVDTDVEMGGPNPDPQVEVYSGAGKTWGIGKTFMNQFDEDEYAAERARNPYFPFACKPDWETAAFLLRSDLSMVDIDEYLNLEFVSSSIFYITPFEPLLDQDTTSFISIFKRTPRTCRNASISPTVEVSRGSH
jgi:hypothetical protein